MKMIKMTIRVTEDDKEQFKNICKSKNTDPSKEIRQYIHNICNGKDGFILSNNGKHINLLFMQLYQVLDAIECQTEVRQQILKLLNELEKIFNIGGIYMTKLIVNIGGADIFLD